MDRSRRHPRRHLRAGRHFSQVALESAQRLNAQFPASQKTALLFCPLFLLEAAFLASLPFTFLCNLEYLRFFFSSFLLLPLFPLFLPLYFPLCRAALFSRKFSRALLGRLHSKRRLAAAFFKRPYLCVSV